MRVIQQNGHAWLSSATPLPCQFYNQRPDPAQIDLLVIHCISLPRGCYRNGHVAELFAGQLRAGLHPELDEVCAMRVSTHLFIDRLGAIFQFVPFDERAWHAGVSQFAGRDNVNDFSLGIELEGTDDSAFTKQQYQTLAQVTLALQQRYPQITSERIVGHSDVAPGRKTDPGSGFDWELYHRLLQTEGVIE